MDTVPLSRRPGPTVRVRVSEVRGDVARAREDRLATEEPLEVRLGWPGVAPVSVGVTMRTPGHDFELATGLLATQGVVRPDALAAVSYCTERSLSLEERENVVTVRLRERPPLTPAARTGGPWTAGSACGVCGTDTLREVADLAARRAWSRSPGAGTLAPGLLRTLPGLLRGEQPIFATTGGLHAAALVDTTGAVLVTREDIGRHNAVDKVMGARVLAGDSPAAPLLCVSGRLGFEIVQKAVVAGVATVAALGAPSSLAVRLAREAGLGLVGFLGEERHVVYAEPAPVGV